MKVNRVNIYDARTAVRGFGGTRRPISALTATTSSVRSTRSLMAVSVGLTSPRSTVAYSSTNVALGLYAEALQRAGYRDAKIRTVLDTVPDVVGPGGSEIDMRWTGPGGHEHHAGAVVLVSNNQYRLGHAVGSGTPGIDNGLLGIIVVGASSGRGQDGSSPQRPLRAWSAPTFEIDADQPVAAGIDGEALVLDAPLHFRIRPGVLWVHIARKHPGASPSARAPEGMWASIVELARIAFGHDTKPASSTPERPE